VSRISFITGILIAATLHGLIFVPALFREATDREPKLAERPKPTVAFVPPRPPEPKGPPTARQPPMRPSSSETKQVAELQKVVSQTGDQQPEAEDGNTSIQEADEASLPALQIVWQSPQELWRVVQALRMKIVAVNSAGEILGEVALHGQPQLVRFEGNLSHYSNRVRTLPRRFFGPGVLSSANQEIEHFWILVPSSLDRQFVEVQREAVRRSGRKSEEITAVEAAFERTRSSYQLVVRRVI